MACRPGLPSCLFKKNYRRKNKLIKIINKVNKGCFGPKRLNQFLGTYGALWGSSSSSSSSPFVFRDFRDKVVARCTAKMENVTIRKNNKKD